MTRGDTDAISGIAASSETSTIKIPGVTAGPVERALYDLKIAIAEAIHNAARDRDPDIGFEEGEPMTRAVNRYGNAIRDRAFSQGYRGGWNDALDEAREDLRRRRRR